MARMSPGAPQTSWWHRTFGRKESGALTWLHDALMWAPAKSGVSVTWQSALQVAAVFACCRVIAEGIAQSGVRLMRPAAAGGREPALDHPLYRLLYRAPNAWQTAFEFWETLVLHLVLLGNAYVFISRGLGDRPAELIILDPARVLAEQAADRTLTYLVTGLDGSPRRLDQDRIWHLRGMSWDGWRGLDPVKIAREAIGLSLALEEAHARLHANGAQPSGVYSVEGTLTDEQHKKLTGWIKANAAGESRGAPLVLDKAAKWLTQQMSGVDAQHLETRRYQVEEVCRVLRVMPIMLGLSEKTATYASSEQMFLAHKVHGIDPWAERLEQSAEVALLSEDEAKAGYEVVIHTEALVIADFKSRQEGLAIQRRNGVINANEWRLREGLNPRGDPGGPQYIVEANMAIQDGRDLPPPKADPATPPKPAA